MATFLLLHGAFRGGWQWDAVTDLLVRDGHVVHAPDLLGAGSRAAQVHGEPIGLEETLDDLQELVEREDLRGVVLAGHSQGGLVARALSHRIPTRVLALGLLDAPDPDDGERALDFGPADAPPPPRDLLVPPRPLVAEGDLDAEAAAALTTRLTPQSAALALDPVRLDDAAAAALPVRRAFCTGTPEGYPSSVSLTRARRRGLGFLLLDAPHEAPLCAPRLVAQWLGEVAQVR